MKPIFALFVVLLLLVANINLSHARNDLGDYWKQMMNDQPMPQAIKDLIQEHQVQDARADHFIRYFNIKPNIILYHTHVVSKKQQKQKAFDRKFKPVSRNGKSWWLNKPSKMVED